jgi:iron complex transport system substrate-binding protein
MLLAWMICLMFVASALPAQTVFVDDAQRKVTLPSRIQKVFAAGFPAEVMLYTLAPDMLAGRNHPPAEGAIEFVPPAYRTLVPIANLPDRDDPAFDVDLLKLRPDVFIDYGSLHKDYVDKVEAVQTRTGIASIILDGKLERIPAMYRRLGTALGIAARGEQLAAEVERIMARYRMTLAAGSASPRVYWACTPDGTIPCLEGESSGELITILGAVNAAGTIDKAPMRPLTLAEIRELEPDVIVVSGAANAARFKADPGWQAIAAVAAGRVLSPPEFPYNWTAHPPSVNRVPGLMWLSYVLLEKNFDAAFFADLSSFFRIFYHMEPTEAQLERLVGTR